MNFTEIDVNEFALMMAGRFPVKVEHLFEGNKAFTMMYLEEDQGVAVAKLKNTTVLVNS